MSIEGGLDRAIYRGRALGCRVIQIFTHSNSRWTSPPITPEAIHAFHAARNETGVDPVAVHDSYLVNLASSSLDVRARSLNALEEEIERTGALGIPNLVVHPGSHGGDGERQGLRRISEGLKELIGRGGAQGVRVLLETTAGQGNSLGYRFEHLAEVIERCGNSTYLGVCMDTCHVFTAGYDFRSEESYRSLFQKFDGIIGLDRLQLFHLNDSKRELGSGIDRHEHLGYGFIGPTPFLRLVRDPAFDALPFLIETPKGKNDEGIDWDRINLDFLEQAQRQLGVSARVSEENVDTGIFEGG